jgi:hypothetical protein
MEGGLEAGNRGGAMNARTVLIAVATIGVLGVGYHVCRSDGELPPPSVDVAERNLASVGGSWDLGEKEVPDLGGAQLVIKIRGEEEGAPVVGVGVFAGGEGQPRTFTNIDRDRGGRGEIPRTSEAGIAVLDVGAGYPLTVFVEGEGDFDNRAQVSVPSLAAGETRELEITIRTVFDRIFHLCVLAEEDDRPLPGVEFFVDEGPGAYYSDEVPSRTFPGTEVATATSDTRGMIELPLSSPNPLPLLLVAEGREPARISTVSGFDSPARRMVVRLARAARLHGRVTSDREGFVPDRVRLRVERWDPLGSFLWEGTVDDDGTFAVEGLPTQLPLRVTVEANGTPRFPLTELLLFEPAESRRVEWELGRGAIVHGRVADVEGEGDAGLELWLIPAFEVFGSGGALSFWMTPGDRTRSGGGGEFRFDDVAAGDWVIGLAPASRPFYASADDENLAATSVCFSVPPDRDEVEVTVPLHRGEFIEGRVLPKEEGLPIHPDIMAWRIEGTGSPLGANVDEEGRFRLGPMTPGRYLLRAGTAGLDEEHPAADPFVVEAASGEKDVLLRIPPTGSLSGSVIDRETGKPTPANVTVFSRGGSQAMMSPGRSEFSSLPLGIGEFDVQAQTADGRVGSMLGVQIREEDPVEDLVILLDPGQFVRLRYRGPTEYAQYRFEKDGVIYASDNIRRGTRERTCLPIGSYEVILTGYDLMMLTIPPTRVFEESRAIEVGPGPEPIIEFQIDG